ncbi:MAG TPA: response regulator transcription factor [Longimicrobiales bacterium]|nr:response regulator transcription factor [Longimicrobiales bacterium]
MRILIADDDAVVRQLVADVLANAGHDIIQTANGEDAWDVLNRGGAPRLAVIDWMMPRLDGPDLCRRLRAVEGARTTYIILLTGLQKPAEIVAGLRAGADDYIIKPFHHEELIARVAVGERVVSLQSSLSDRISELEQALAQVHTLQGLIPICSCCKRVRNEREYWEKVESYIAARSGAQFTHGVCPDCSQGMDPEPQH